MEDRNWIIGNNIRTVRKLKEISQELLAEKCNLSVSMIQKVESGKATLSMEKFIVVLDVLGISADTLLSKEQNYHSIVDLFYSIVVNRNEKEISFVLHMVEKLLEGKDMYLT